MRIDTFEFINYRYALSYPSNSRPDLLASCLSDRMLEMCGNANARTVKLVLPGNANAHTVKLVLPSNMRCLLTADQSPIQASGTYPVGTPAQQGCNADNTRCCKALSGAARY